MRPHPSPDSKVLHRALPFVICQARLFFLCLLLDIIKTTARSIIWMLTRQALEQWWPGKCPQCGSCPQPTCLRTEKEALPQYLSSLLLVFYCPSCSTYFAFIIIVGKNKMPALAFSCLSPFLSPGVHCISH